MADCEFPVQQTIVAGTLVLGNPVESEHPTNAVDAVIDVPLSVVDATVDGSNPVIEEQPVGLKVENLKGGGDCCSCIIWTIVIILILLFIIGIIIMFVLLGVYYWGSNGGRWCYSYRFGGYGYYC